MTVRTALTAKRIPLRLRYVIHQLGLFVQEASQLTGLEPFYDRQLNESF